MVKIKDWRELELYKAGHVVRMKNIISAFKLDDYTQLQQPEMDEDDEGFPVYFFIFSQMGKCMDDFFPPNILDDFFPPNILMESPYKTIVFTAGTEFLVCKHEKVYDNLIGKITHHIYLREIQIGFG